MENCFIAVDVGTQSVRASIVQSDGSISGVVSLPIKTYNPYPNMYEQSSDEIWALCVQVIKVGFLFRTVENIS